MTSGRITGRGGMLPPSRSGLERAAPCLVRALANNSKKRACICKVKAARLNRIACGLVQLPGSISDSQFNQPPNQKNYENQILSRRRCLRRKSCFLHAA